VLRKPTLRIAKPLAHIIETAMSNQILLQDVLPLDELRKQGKILLVRHSHDNIREMYLKNIIEEYQSFQDKPAFLNFKFIICFLGSERNSASFYGIYELIEILKGKKVPEVLSKTANQKYCTEKESNWKEKLGSRAFGLNKN